MRFERVQLKSEVSSFHKLIMSCALVGGPGPWSLAVIASAIDLKRRFEMTSTDAYFGMASRLRKYRSKKGNFMPRFETRLCALRARRFYVATGKNALTG